MFYFMEKPKKDKKVIDIKHIFDDITDKLFEIDKRALADAQERARLMELLPVLYERCLVMSEKIKSLEAENNILKGVK